MKHAFWAAARATTPSAASTHRCWEDLPVLLCTDRALAKYGCGERRHGIRLSQLGNNKRALDALEQAVKDRDVIFPKPNPAFDPLRSDPRFVDILRSMGLPQ